MKKNVLVIAAVLTLAAGTPAVAGAKAKPVSLNTAAKRFVNKANASAKKKSGKTKLKVVIKGSVKWSEVGKAVSAIHCKNVRKNTEKAFRDEVLCRTSINPKFSWANVTLEKKGKNTVLEAVFKNNRMNKYSSYGKVNYIEQAEKKVDKYLNIFNGVFSKKMGKAQLGAFAVSYVHEVGARGNGDKTWYNEGYGRTCAKGVSGVSIKYNSCCCEGRAYAATKIMRILGFKKNECGVVRSDNHAWNWWKDEKGTVYFGDATDGRGIEAVYRETGDEYQLNAFGGWYAIVKDKYDRPAQSWVDDLGYESIEAADERLEELCERMREGLDKDGKAKKEADMIHDCDFETFNKYVEVKGFYTITRAEVAKEVKTGNSEWDSSDGKKGTNWEILKLDFKY